MEFAIDPDKPQLPLEPVPNLRGALPSWLKIAALSFGGPAGQIAVMHRVLVDEKRWIDDARFLHALSFCMVLPGPEAMHVPLSGDGRIRPVRRSD